MQTPKETKTTKTSMKTTQINYDRDKDDEEDDVRSEQEEEEENQSPTWMKETEVDRNLFFKVEVSY